MRLVEFTVTNFRSITKQSRLAINDLTVLVGKNNEGKSNMLTALSIAMRAMQKHGKGNMPFRSARELDYNWRRDFPVQLQVARKTGFDSIFKLVFRLNEEERVDFQSSTKIHGNEDIPITIKIGKSNSPVVEIPKKGSSSYKRKSAIITEFVSQRITFNYIKAIRTDDMAIDELINIIWQESVALSEKQEYMEAQDKLRTLQKEFFDEISQKLRAPLEIFLPNLKSVEIEDTSVGNIFPYFMHNRIDISIDDGIKTSIRYKGDGIKSLLALAILKNRGNIKGASVVAIEEPESHLHPGAIHNLVDVIHKISENSQVIITTHNPLFIKQNSISDNIIVDDGIAKPAKSIADIRNVLGVWPSDNLQNARYVLVVEGENDKIILSTLLSLMSEKIKHAIASNQMVILPLYGVTNLKNRLFDLERYLCKYIVLLDSDKIAKDSAEEAIKANLLKNDMLRYVTTRGKESEIEDCINPSITVECVNDEFMSNLKKHDISSGTQKWSDRVEKACKLHGFNCSETALASIKRKIADTVSNKLLKVENGNIDEIFIPQQSQFIPEVVSLVNNMLDDETKKL